MHRRACVCVTEKEERGRGFLLESLGIEHFNTCRRKYQAMSPSDLVSVWPQLQTGQSTDDCVCVIHSGKGTAASRISQKNLFCRFI